MIWSATTGTSSFELVARRAKARYVLGLSATVTRKDGHHPIIAMQCGPIRHRVDARSEAAKRPFDHLVRIRETASVLARMAAKRRNGYHAIGYKITSASDLFAGGPSASNA
jgi:superfamily II DNA or RNA helicase